MEANEMQLELNLHEHVPSSIQLPAMTTLR